MGIREKVKKVIKEGKYQITGKRSDDIGYKIDFSEQFKKDYGMLPEDIQEEIKKAIRKVVEDPYRGELIEDKEGN